MAEKLDVQMALELHALERQWSTTCKRSRSIERAFCVTGLAFCATTAWVAFRPSVVFISIYLSVWLGLLALLVLFLPLLIFGAWREWVVYRKMAFLVRHPGVSDQSGWRAQLRLFVDYARSARS